MRLPKHRFAFAGIAMPGWSLDLERLWDVVGCRLGVPGRGFEPISTCEPPPTRQRLGWLGVREPQLLGMLSKDPRLQTLSELLLLLEVQTAAT